MNKRLINIVLILLFATILFAKNDKLNQKTGLLQKQKSAHISFRSFKKYKPKPNEPAISRSEKILIFNNRVYVLDGRLHRLYVFDKELKYLFTIGRPGQGPGDLENPRDVFISENGEIFILNSHGKQIEVFSQTGDFVKRLSLNIPKEYLYSRPTKILLKKNSIYTCYHLGPSYVDEYDKNGEFIRTVFKRTEPIYIPGKNLSNASHMLLDNQDSIVHFNYFSGIFTKIRLNNSSSFKFSAHNDRVEKYIKKVSSDIQNKRKKKQSITQSASFIHWSDFCKDQNGNFYVSSLLIKKEESPELYAFSSDGNFLYSTKIPYFKGTRIKQFACSDETFVFITEEEELFYTIKKGG